MRLAGKLIFEQVMGSRGDLDLPRLALAFHASGRVDLTALASLSGDFLEERGDGFWFGRGENCFPVGWIRVAG